MISITPDFNLNDLNKHIDGTLNNILDEIADNMFDAGKLIVDKARAKTRAENGFNNITWNLRASIGCVLVYKHQIKGEHIYFPPISEGSEGRSKGIAYAKEISLLVDDGDPVLVFVAGMDYALFVEATDRDVITMSSVAFGPIFKQLINEQ